METEEWTVVGGKNKKGRRGTCKSMSLKAANALNQAQKGFWAPGVVVEGGDVLAGDLDSPQRVASAEEKIARAAGHILAAPFFKVLESWLAIHCPGDETQQSPNCAQSVEGNSQHAGEWRWAPAPAGVQSLVVYGLGSLIASSVSCSQLALSDVLLQRRGFASVIATSSAWVFDPVLSDDDRQILRNHHLQILQEDEAGARRASGPTLFYMPHCEAVLYDNLLKANWSRDTLPLVAILGNSFKTYADRWEFKAANAVGRPHYILKVLEYASEMPLGDTGSGLIQGFNDTSLLMFPPSALPDALDPFWSTEA